MSRQVAPEDGRLYIREGRNYVAVEGSIGCHIARLSAALKRFDRLRDALVESMGTEGGIPMTDRLADALDACGIDAKREAFHG